MSVWHAVKDICSSNKFNLEYDNVHADIIKMHTDVQSNNFPLFAVGSNFTLCVQNLCVITHLQYRDWKPFWAFQPSGLLGLVGTKVGL